MAVAGSATTRGVSARPRVGASSRGFPIGGESAAVHSPAPAGLSPKLRGEASELADRKDLGDTGSQSPSAGSHPLDAGDPAVGVTDTHSPSRSGVVGGSARLAFAGRTGLHHSDAGLALGVPDPPGVPGLFTHSPSLIADAGAEPGGGLDPPPRASLGFGRTTWSRTLGDGVGPRWSRYPRPISRGEPVTPFAPSETEAVVWLRNRVPSPVGAGRPGSATAAGRSLLTVRNGGGGVAA